MQQVEPRFAGINQDLRLHGDCHLCNVLWGTEGPFWVDFDDCMTGPAVQDLWLTVPDIDDYGVRQRELLVQSYQTMRHFNRAELELIEPLRAYRYLYYSAWIGRRWQDQAFKAVFPQFNEYSYWQAQLGDLEVQLQKLTQPYATQ